MVYVGRSIWTLAGLLLLSLAFIAEFQHGLVAAAAVQAPGFVRSAIEALFAREPLLHGVAAVAALAGFLLFATSWPILVSLTVLLGRAAVSAVGAVLIAAAVVAVLDQTFFGLFEEAPAPAYETEEGGGSGPVIVYAAAAMLGFIGLTIAIAPWRRNTA